MEFLKKWSFYWPKMHFLKKGQKIWAWVDPPPSFGQCPKENVFFHCCLPYHAFQSEFLLIINPRRGTRTTTIPAWNIRFAFFLEIQCTFWPLLVNLPYNVKSCTTKKTTRCLPRNAACNHNLKLTQKKSQQWNQSMVELGGNKSEKQQCVIKPMGDFTSTPAHSQAMESLWAAAK